MKCLYNNINTYHFIQFLHTHFFLIKKKNLPNTFHTNNLQSVMEDLTLLYSHGLQKLSCIQKKKKLSHIK